MGDLFKCFFFKNIAQYGILFLDIDLGKESGIDLARKMRKMNPEAVLIFVTNFSEYAPEGYEVDAFRYLAKSELEKKLPTYFEDRCNHLCGFILLQSLV